MKKAEKELRIQNLEALGKRLLREGKTMDAYTIRLALDLFPRSDTVRSLNKGQ